MSDYLEDEISQIAMNAMLGQAMVNAISSTASMGHTNLRHTLVYVHSDDPTVKLACAILQGGIDDAKAALEAWAGVPVLEIQRQHMARVFESAFKGVFQ